MFARPLGPAVTTLIAWIGIDQRGPSSLYLASDSRITWGSQDKRWDVGRKLFACKQLPDVFGYVGEVVFPSLVLGQIVESADSGLIGSASDTAQIRHEAYVHAIRVSFSHRHSAPNHKFEILHAAREGDGMAAGFRVWRLSYSPAPDSWHDTELGLPSDRSGLIAALGSGAPSVEMHEKKLAADSQGRTSRAVFWAFCDALEGRADPLSGGAPQLVGIYRTQGPKAFGLLYQGVRYFHGLSLEEVRQFDTVEWRDKFFQRIDGETLRVVDGAQRHGRAVAD